MTRSLDELPLELLNQVLSYILSKSSLVNVARCSRYLNLVALPHLYGHLELLDDPRCEFHDPHFAFLTRVELRPLASLLLRNPALARLVRRFTILRCYAYTTGHGLFPEDQPVEVEDVFRGAVKAAAHSAEEERTWLEDLVWPEDVDATLALLLPALTQLGRLDLVVSDDMRYFNRMMWRVAHKHKPFNDCPAFQQLTHVMLRPFHFQPWVRVRVLAAFLSLPSMRLVFSYSVSDGIVIADRDDGDRSTMAEVARELGRASSEVTHIEFKSSRVTMPDLELFLQIPRALKTFIYELADWEVGSDNHSSTALRNALKPQEHCLEDLWLDYDYGHVGGPMSLTNEDELTPIAPFSSCKRLKRLRIATVFVFGRDHSELHGDPNDGFVSETWSPGAYRGLVNLLPPTLELLRLTHCDDHETHLYRAVQELLASPPRPLRRIVLEGFVKKPWHPWADMVQLASTAAERGIQLVLINMEQRGKQRPGTRAGDLFVERGWGMDGEFCWAQACMGFNAYPPPEVIDLSHE